MTTDENSFWALVEGGQRYRGLGVLAQIFIAFIAVSVLLASCASPAQAAWFDAAWEFRRPIDVTWDAEHGGDDALATAEFYSDGHALPDASDIRVATEDGKLVPSHILMKGPGDRIRVVFNLQKGIKKYAVYFGNPKPAAAPAGMGDVNFKAGLMIETRAWTGGVTNSFKAIEQSWDRSKTVFGQAMIPNAFLGYNIFGDQQQWISKVVGSLFVPMDGEYTFAMSVDDDGALYIDGQPLLLAHLGPSDIRYHASITLSRGAHDFMLYHVNVAAEGRFAVAWKRPDQGQFEIIGREAFGTCVGSQAGALEERGKSLVPDFSLSQAGECFFADHYSFRYHFTSLGKSASAMKLQWDFGDGQISEQGDPDHVYLLDGVYPVRLTFRIGDNTVTQTSNVVVGRDYEKILDATEDDPKVLSRIVAAYDLGTAPAASLARMVALHLAANRLDAAITAANRLAPQRAIPDPVAAVKCLMEVDHDLIDSNRADVAQAIWDRCPENSYIQPDAARRSAELAMWWRGDFAKAVKTLEPFKTHPDQTVRRLYGEALILDGKPEEGKEILRSLPAQAQENRQAALSGASARSVEFFIRSKETEAGEDAWERWQTRFPSDFLEGYSVLLRTKLIEQRKMTDAAAKVAEAFALAMPQSSYAPQLLDRASKLLADSDPAKSQSLRQLLKEKYPEDPLAQ